ncbi:hypothetical protein [Nocardia cyriacigeorgica]|uniref:hypothetical protein n=1 Tax=Nocardia cyriacigeorgica TaxID=135487 RepID=UPI002454E68E|nr:hypothetical protein [Nocardia cyriacigeorgica]
MTGRRTIAGGVALLLVVGAIGFWISQQKGTERMEGSSGVNTVLSIGLGPAALDYSRIPGLDQATLTARIAAGEAALREAGFDFVSCQVPADPDAAEARIRACAAEPFGVAMIGAGVRMAPEYTLLFERLVNVVNDISPGVKFCFNTSPESTIDALRRWVQPSKS